MYQSRSSSLIKLPDLFFSKAFLEFNRLVRKFFLRFLQAPGIKPVLKYLDQTIGNILIPCIFNVINQQKSISTLTNKLVRNWRTPCSQLLPGPFRKHARRRA